ncbi:hypothetical protein Efla_004268 [Eimeria flavescens]
MLSNVHPFAVGFLQQQQKAAAPSVDWEAAAKRYSSVRGQAPSREQQQQQQAGHEGGGKRKRVSKEQQGAHEDTTEEDVMPPDTPGQAEGYADRAADQIGILLRQADEAPYSYETLNALVSALCAAGPEKLEDYEAALERLLFEFPLLFGYWKKLARLQCEHKGDWTKCEEVFERALEFVGHNPLIWVAYFEWLKQFGALPTRLVRAKMDQALNAAGAHWKAWPLWQTILEWEEEELFNAREKILAAEQGAPLEETGADSSGNPGVESQSLVDRNKACMQRALERLRLLYAALLKTPLESSDLTWDRLKSFVEKGSRSSNKSRRGPRTGGPSDAEAAGGTGATKGASTLIEVYDLLTDEQLPLLLQRLQQQKSATLDELQMPAEAAAAEAEAAQAASDSRAAIKARGELVSVCLLAASSVSSLASLNAVDGACWQLLREQLDGTLSEAEKRRPFEKATHRWFWHPDPLAPRRLQAWREYLDFEEKHAPHRLGMLQRRCLEVCASYPEFWLRCARQRQRQRGNDEEEGLRLLEFGATKVLKRRRDMGCLYASRLELCGKLQKAAQEYEALVRPPWDPASLKYFVALLQFSLRHPPETAADGLSHALLLLQEAAEKYRDSVPCAELLHLYRAKLVAFHEGDTKKALGILSRARESLPKSLPLLLLQLRLLQQLHAGSVEKILSSSKPLLSEIIACPDADAWLQWQALKLQTHLYEFYGAPTATLHAAKEAATAFLEKHREDIVALAARAELRRLPPQLLLPYGDNETEAAAADGAAAAGDWAHADSQAQAEVSASKAYELLSSAAAAATAQVLHPHPQLTWLPLHPEAAAANSAPCSTACCSSCSSSDKSGDCSRSSSELWLSPAGSLDSADGVIKCLQCWSPSRMPSPAAAAAAAAGAFAARTAAAAAPLTDSFEASSPSPPTKRQTPGAAITAGSSPLWPWVGAAVPSPAAAAAADSSAAAAAAAVHRWRAGTPRQGPLTACRTPADFAALCSAIASCCYFPSPMSPLLSVFPCLSDDRLQQEGLAAAVGDKQQQQQQQQQQDQQQQQQRGQQYPVSLVEAIDTLQQSDLAQQPQLHIDLLREQQQKNQLSLVLLREQQQQQQQNPLSLAAAVATLRQGDLAQQQQLHIDLLRGQQKQYHLSLALLREQQQQQQLQRQLLQQQQQMQQCARDRQGDEGSLLETLHQHSRHQPLQQQSHQGCLMQRQASLQQELQLNCFQEEDSQQQQQQQQQQVCKEGEVVLPFLASSCSTAAAAGAAAAASAAADGAASKASDSTAPATTSQQRHARRSDSSGSCSSSNSPEESSSRASDNCGVSAFRPCAAAETCSPLESHSGCSRSSGSSSSSSSSKSKSSSGDKYTPSLEAAASLTASSPLLAGKGPQQSATAAEAAKVAEAPISQQALDGSAAATANTDSCQQQQQEQQQEQEQQHGGKSAQMCLSMSSSSTVSTAASASAGTSEAAAGDAATAAAAQKIEGSKESPAPEAAAAPQLLSVRQLVGRHIAEAGKGLSFMRCFSLHNLRLALETGSLRSSPPRPLEGLSLSAVADALCSEAAAVAAARGSSSRTPALKVSAAAAAPAAPGDEPLVLSAFLPGLVALQEDWLSFASARVFVFSLCSQLQLHPEVSFLAVRYMGWLLLDWNSWQPPPELLFPPAAGAAVPHAKLAEEKQQRQHTHRRQHQKRQQQQQQQQEDTAAANRIRVARALWGVPLPPQRSSTAAAAGAATASGAECSTSRSSSSSNSSQLHPLPVLLRLGCLCISLALRQVEITPAYDTRQLTARAAAQYAAQEAAKRKTSAATAAAAHPRGCRGNQQQQQQQQRQQQPQQRQQRQQQQGRQQHQQPLRGIANLPLLRHQWDPSRCPLICRDLQLQQQQQQQQEQQHAQPRHNDAVAAVSLPFPLTGWLELFAWSCISNFNPSRPSAAPATAAATEAAAAEAGQPAAASEGDIASQASSNNLLLWLLEALKLRSSSYGAQWLHQEKGSCSKCCCSGLCSRSSGSSISGSNSSSSSNSSDHLHRGLGKAAQPAAHTASIWASQHVQQAAQAKQQQRQQQQQEPQQEQQPSHGTEADSLLLLPALLPEAQLIHLRGGHQLPQALLLLLVGSPHPASIFLPPAVHVVGVLLLLLQSYPSSSSSKLQQLLRAVVGPQLMQQSLGALKLIAAAIVIAAKPHPACCSSCGCCCPLPLAVQHTLQQLLQQDMLESLRSSVSTTRLAAVAAADDFPPPDAQQQADSSSKRKKRPLDCGTSSLPLSASPSPASDPDCPYSWPAAAAAAEPAAATDINPFPQQQSGRRSKQHILITADDSPCLANSQWRQATPRCSNGSSSSSGKSSGSPMRSNSSSTSCLAAEGQAGPVSQRPQYQASPFSPWAAWSVSEALSNKPGGCCFPPDIPCCCSQQRSSSSSSDGSSSSNNNGSSSNKGGGKAKATTRDTERPRRTRRWDAWQQHAYQQQLQQHYAALGFDCSQLYSCYNETVQQQQQLLMYGDQQQLSSSSSMGSWVPSGAAAALSAAAASTAASSTSGSSS